MNIEPQIIIFAHVIISGILGGIVGLEREISRKPAGIRTHMLVSATATVLVFLSSSLITFATQINPSALIQSDPNRIIEAIIVGISFIGAGTIIKNPTDTKVSHLITAASILFVATIGISVAINQLFLAACLALFAVVVNYGVGYLEKDFKRGEDKSK